MKEKFFDINDLYVGCLGNIQYLEEEKQYNWSKKNICPYIIFKKHLSNYLDNCHEGKNIFSNERYYFLNEISRRNSTMDIVYGHYIIGKSIPLSIVCGSDKKMSYMELKSIICNFNITDALIKYQHDKYLSLLKSCLDEIDLMEEGKVKEYYIDNISSLISRYTNVIMNSSDTNEFDVVSDINKIRHELDKEKEIDVKMMKKMK